MTWMLLALVGCNDPDATEPPHDEVTEAYDRARKDWVDKIEDPFAREEARMQVGKFARCLFQ